MMPHLLNSNNLCTSLKDCKTEFANRTKSVSKWIFELYLFPKRKRLFAGTVPVNKNLFAGTVPANKNLFAGTIPANKNLFAGTCSGK